MPIKIDKEAFYKLEELSDILDRSIPTLRRWCKEGTIPGVKKVKSEWIVPGWGIIECLSSETKPKKGGDKK